MRTKSKFYPSDLTDAQWNSIRPLLPKANCRGRPRQTKLRLVVSAVFFVNRTGAAWRYLPSEFPPWQTVYSYFQRWQKRGIWRQLHDILVRRVRKRSGRAAWPTCAIVDSQAVKAAMGEERGYDGFKKVRGRKRQILVDTLGQIHAIRVHKANLPDCLAGRILYEHCRRPLLRRLKAILADMAYRGTFVEETEKIFGFPPSIHVADPSVALGSRRKTTKEKRAHKRLHDDVNKRWIVERTFAWLNFYRRLSRDYERKVEASEAMVYIAMTQIALHRLQPEEGGRVHAFINTLR